MYLERRRNFIYVNFSSIDLIWNAVQYLKETICIIRIRYPKAVLHGHMLSKVFTLNNVKRGFL
jgi:hypothetical protein